VADLKDKSKHRFKHHETGIKGVQYVQFPADGPSPQEVVISVMKEAKATMTLRARNCSRFLPVTHTCFASVEAIKEISPKVLEGHFPAEVVEGGPKGVQFAVEYEHRSFQGINRLEIINAFTDQIKCPPNKVNLTNPEKTILVQMLKSVCAVSVVTNYKELSKFNIKLITESKDDKLKKEEPKKVEAKKETEPEKPKEE
jgi:tRNA acetyltransferase TAN1